MTPQPTSKQSKIQFSGSNSNQTIFGTLKRKKSISSSSFIKIKTIEFTELKMEAENKGSD